jgi:hypothetical protein
VQKILVLVSKGSRAEGPADSSTDNRGLLVGGGGGCSDSSEAFSAAGSPGTNIQE